MATRTVEGPASLLSGAFARDTRGLVAATLASQALGLAALVAMDRLYTQAHIGEYSAFLSWIAILSPLTLQAYHLEIPNLQDEGTLHTLLGLLAALAGGSSAVAGLGFALVGYPFAPHLAGLLLASAALTACEMLNIRRQRFGLMVAARLLPSGLLLGLVVLLGRQAPSSGKLVGAHLAAMAAVAAAIGGLSMAGHRLRFQGLAEVARRERDYSRLVMPSQLFNVAAYHLPTILIERYLGAALAAQYAVTLRFCFAPVRMVGDAVAQVYHSRLARAVREGSEDLAGPFRRLARALGLLGLAAGAGCLVVLPWLVRLLLGEGWEMAEGMIRLLAPLYGAMMAVVPLEIVFVVLKERAFLFRMQLAYLAISAGCFGRAVAAGELVAGVAGFTALSVARYAWIYLAARRRITRSTSATKASALRS